MKSIKNKLGDKTIERYAETYEKITRMYSATKELFQR
jgi:hypothetical protein